MEVRYRTCDHCGKRLDPMKDYEECELDKYGLIRADLCAECYGELEAMVQRFLKPEDTP